MRFPIYNKIKEILLKAVTLKLRLRWVLNLARLRIVISFNFITNTVCSGKDPKKSYLPKNLTLPLSCGHVI